MTGERVIMSGEVKGKPSAEPVLRVDTREELVYLLGQACEIEHGLMCEYLYAQFSLKRGLDEGLTEAQLARVQAWEKALIGVIKQEMLHLALATNILTAIGAAPIAVKMFVASARCSISCLITPISAFSQACTRASWASVRPSSSPRLSENCAYRYSHINPCSISHA